MRIHIRLASIIRKTIWVVAFYISHLCSITKRNAPIICGVIIVIIRSIKAKNKFSIFIHFEFLTIQRLHKNGKGLIWCCVNYRLRSKYKWECANRRSLAVFKC